MKQKAFTLIELLVVIGIIGILSAIGVVSFGAMREKARRGACIATLRSNFNSDENLVAYWNFDESLGTQEYCTTAKDFWGNNGACKPISGSNAPQYTTNKNGIIDYGLSFDEIDDYISIPDSNSLDVTTDFTFEAWVYLNNLTNNYIFTKDNIGGDNTGGYNFYTTNKLQLEINNIVTFESTQVLTTANWTHVVLTHASGQYHFYINGAFSNTINNANNPYILGSTLLIGRRGFNNCCHMNGLIDEVIIYNRTLSADEIASHYKACKK